MKCKLQLMCFKSILSKIVCDSLNLFHKMLRLLRSGNDGALLQACEEDLRYLQFQPCHGEYCRGVRLWSGVPSLFWTLMIKRC